MNENINLCEALKGLEGIKLWTSVFGYVKLQEVRNADYSYPILVVTSDKHIKYFTKDGKVENYEDSECVIFPDKDQRDWSKFGEHIPIDTPMMYTSSVTGIWSLGYYAGKNGDGFHRCFAEGKKLHSFASYLVNTFPLYMIPFDKFNPNDIEESLKYNIQK